MKTRTTYKKLTAKIVFITLIFTVSCAFIYGEYVKREAIANLAHIDAKKTSRLIFETLYSAMQKGWDKQELQEIVKRLNAVDSAMRVNVYRSDSVAQLYGEIERDKTIRTDNERVKQAMNSNEILNITKHETIEYYYPVIATQECLKCHTNAKDGDVLGVIDVSYPVGELKVSLSEMVSFFLFFIVGFSIIIFLAIFLELDRYLIKPIKKFSETIVAISNSHDISKRVELDEDVEELDSIKRVFNEMLNSIEYQFYYDSLTGLENRRRLTQTLEIRKNYFLAIINIDSFQEINDLYGEEAGDEILKSFATHLREIAPSSAKLYRLHSDEFANLCSSSMDLDEFKAYVSYLIESISKKSFTVKDKGELSLTVSAGISYGSELLLANADIALKLAKKHKKNYLFYDESMQMEKEYEKNFEWTKKIKKAIEDDKIVPLFQPIVNSTTKRIEKFESLMRMIDSNGDYIAPIYFLELSKKNKLYHHLTKIMITKTFEKFEDLPFSFSINLSVEDMLNKEVVELIYEKLSNSKSANRAVFEILESEGIENFEQVSEFVAGVKKYGAKIAIDDFGTGYSNFEYLMKLGVDFIKIDGSIIKNIDSQKNSQMITQTIVDFAKKMGIKTIAEFVYSDEIYKSVKNLGIDYAQGYYFGKPDTI